ncbi:MAG: hypothetical protein KDI75_07660, partial [Xanthomonadales bacterium]|nr:hypothetical protein [Xanthomonadales bacterium]
LFELLALIRRHRQGLLLHRPSTQSIDAAIFAGVGNFFSVALGCRCPQSAPATALPAVSAISSCWIPFASF